MRMKRNEDLKPGMVLLLPFNQTATITDVKVGRTYVNLKTREYGNTRVGRYEESMVEVPEDGMALDSLHQLEALLTQALDDKAVAGQIVIGKKRAGTDLTRALDAVRSRIETLEA